MAERLRPRSESRRRLIVAGLVALALLGLGEAAPAALPVEVSIEGHGSALAVSVDGQQHTLASLVGPGWRGIALEQPGPLEREYQVDGSDTTSQNDRQPQVLRPFLGSPMYKFDAWLRDETSYSRWAGLQVTDLATGKVVDGAVLAAGQATDGVVAGTDPAMIGGGAGALPTDFRIDAGLQRPEAPARLWLVGPAGQNQREGLELDRDRRNARWLVQRGATVDALPRWFFPERPAPFAADLLQLLGRSAAAAFALGLAATVIGRMRSAARVRTRGQVRTGTGAWGWDAGGLRWRMLGIAGLAHGGWLVAAVAVAVRLFHQLPHILDAVSYTFQAGLLASGRIAIPTPPLVSSFKGPFGVVWQGHLFSQYPPGAPAAYALGQLVHLEWLVGPLACLALIGTTAWTASVLFGRVCGMTVLVLSVLSPFVLFQSGSFLSHPVAGGLLACALASFVAGERSGRERWYALSGVFLGMSFVTREAASVLFALPLAIRLLALRRWRPLTLLVAYGTPFLLVYLSYNTRLTGSPLLLPRMIFDPSDHFGFGDGVGFHGRHTLAAGLANTDELLTLLQFDLFGWPPLFGLGLLGVPFLFNRFRTWDVLAAGGVLAFIVTYTGFYYHGIALGPRYYFEAMPWLVVLAGRGAQVLARLARSRFTAVALLGLLCLNTVLFYLPAELQRRMDFSALPGDRKISLDFVQSTPFGPRLSGVHRQSLVITDDWWLYNAALASLNCPTLPDCDVLFALASTPADLSGLEAQFPSRAVLQTRDDAGHIELVPTRGAQ